MLDKSVYVECACTSIEHTIRFVLDKKNKEIVSEIYLDSNSNNLFKRIWVAIKYAFGYTCVYGHWDCTIIRGSEALKLRDLLNEIVEEKRND